MKLFNKKIENEKSKRFVNRAIAWGFVGLVALGIGNEIYDAGKNKGMEKVEDISFDLGVNAGLELGRRNAAPEVIYVFDRIADVGSSKYYRDPNTFTDETSSPWKSTKYYISTSEQGREMAELNFPGI